MQLRSRFALATLFLINLILAKGSLADTMSCFEFEIPNSPANIESHHHSESSEKETWCYQTRKNQGSSSTLVFRRGELPYRPELSALVESSESGEITQVTHASLSKGDVTFHALSHPTIEILPVPLSKKKANRMAMPVPVTLNRNAVLSVEKLWEQFENKRPQPTRITVKEGEFEGYLSDDKLPYNGYWWSFDDLQLSSGPRSPLGKYDGIVQKWTGTNPKSSDWENANHSDQVVAWGGHCNGWAASSILYPDFTKFLWSDEVKQVVFPSDIKGMLAEASFCVDYAFYGTRYNSSTDDLRDIYPDKFHHVVLYYINTLEKPIAFDHYPNEHVDNNVISGYHFSIKKDPDHANTFKVAATIRAHNYNFSRDELGGPANKYDLNYSYSLVTDASGNVVSGKWDDSSDNPDFLWVPLGQKLCSSENPNLDPDQIEKIRDTLPEAVQKQSDMNFALNRPLKEDESVDIPVPDVHGVQLKIKPTENDLGAGVYLVATGDTQYPSRYQNEGVTVYSQADAGGTFTLPLGSLKTLKLMNSQSSPTTGKKFTIKSIQYLGGGN